MPCWVACLSSRDFLLLLRTLDLHLCLRAAPSAVDDSGGDFTTVINSDDLYWRLDLAALDLDFRGLVLCADVSSVTHNSDSDMSVSEEGCAFDRGDGSGHARD